mgnify:CR=1 FL=1
MKRKIESRAELNCDSTEQTEMNFCWKNRNGLFCEWTTELNATQNWTVPERNWNRNERNVIEMKVSFKALLVKANKGDVRASEVILNRAYGMAKQPIQLDAKVETTNLTLDEAKELASKLKDEH